MTKSGPRHSSTEFGSFTSAAASNIHEPNLLGSYDGPPQSTGDTSWLADFDPLHSPPKPIHVNLPPRPDEIAPDYVPPIRIPRRLSQHAQQYSSAGPSSPPLVSEAQIIFHPSVQTQDAASRTINQARQNSFRQKASSFDTAGPSKLKLPDFANTSRSTSKWRTAFDPSVFVPPDTALDAPVITTAVPIDVTHTTPFASAEQIAGSHVPAPGAPGFTPQTLAPNGRAMDDNSIRLLDRRETTHPVLTRETADRIRSYLPPRQRLSRTWTLLFSLDQHGASLATLYTLVGKYTPTHPNAGNLMIIRDSDNNLFGVFLNAAIAKREGAFYGGGESFLFRVSDDQIYTYPWTGRHQYFALCETDHLSFGGGGSAYGLVVDSTFTRNSSATSPVFDNDILCTAASLRSDKARRFECVGVEVWGTM